MRKRDFLGALALGSLCAVACAEAQTAAPAAPARRARAEVPTRKATTTVLYKVPEGFPNALSGTPEGLWVGEQKSSDAPVKTEKAMLLDWKTGKLLKTVVTNSVNTSGMAVGGGFVWMGANGGPNGIFQTDMNSTLIAQRQIPLGSPPPGNGGGTHGMTWRDNKVWIVANRLKCVMRVDPVTWTPEYAFAFNFPRWHDIAFDADGALWMVTGTTGMVPSNQAGLAKFNPTTGELLELVQFGPGTADPHGLEIRDGVFYSCDAGISPGFVPSKSPSAGTIFRIDIV
jgi:hypothetical protein